MDVKNIKEYARLNNVKCQEVAESLGMEKNAFLKIIENPSSDQINECRAAIDKIAAERIISNAPIERPKKKKSHKDLRYDKYRKHNSDIIDYMLSKNVGLIEIKEYLEIDAPFINSMKSGPLNKEQAAAVIAAIDDIFANKIDEGALYDIWGKRIRHNQDIRKLAKENHVSLDDVRRKLHLSSDMYYNLMRTEMTEDEKEQFKTAIMEVAALNQEKGTHCHFWGWQ